MKTSLLLFLSALFILTACSKSSTKVSGSGALTIATLSGYWFGTFSAGNEGQVFKSDGTTVQYDFYGTNITDSAQAPYKGYGTYTIKGDSVLFNVVYPAVGNETFNEHALVNTSASPNTMAGTYTGSQAGSFVFTRQ